jgi:hypothetical protein
MLQNGMLMRMALPCPNDLGGSICSMYNPNPNKNLIDTFIHSAPFQLAIERNAQSSPSL